MACTTPQKPSSALFPPYAEPPKPIHRPLSLPWSPQAIAFVLDNVVTEEECRHLIAETERRGYIAALINVGGGRQELMTDVRNNTRCIVDSVPDAAEIYRRIEQWLPKTMDRRKILSVNERLRFLRYDPGERFLPHFDGCYERPNGERSYVTIQIYLNEGFEGGTTRFLNPAHGGSDFVDYVPKTGSVLVFEHHLLHEGAELVKGRKYTIRSDIMYDDGTSTAKKWFQLPEDTVPS